MGFEESGLSCSGLGEYMLLPNVVQAAVEQFRDEGYAIVRGFFQGSELEELQRKTAELREIALQHPVTYKHGNLSYEILPEEYFGKRYVIQAYWFAWADKYFDSFRSNAKYLQLLEPLIGNNMYSPNPLQLRPDSSEAHAVTIIV